jgi:hypothetical protein
MAPSATSTHGNLLQDHRIRMATMNVARIKKVAAFAANMSSFLVRDIGLYITDLHCKVIGEKLAM